MKILGLRHIALNVFDVEKCARFYQTIFDMKITCDRVSENILYFRSIVVAFLK